MERRDPQTKPKDPENKPPVNPKPTNLPKDYTAMVKQVFTKNFSKGLGELGKLRPSPEFHVEGQIYPNEIILSVSILYPNEISATTVYASSDFDPTASAPKAEDILNFLVDGAGAFYDSFLNSNDKKKLEQLASPKLSSFEEGVPFQWTQFDINKQEIFLKVDRSHPILEKQADSLLGSEDETEEE